MADIWVDAADGSRQTYVLTRGELIVGRDPQLSVVLSDAKVSRRHARLWLRGEAVWLEDLGSSNGTLLDGVPITQATQLLPNGRVDIGPFTLQLAQAATDLEVALPRYVLSSQQPQLTADIAVPMGEAGTSAAVPLLVGRSATCQIAIDDQSISRRHAQLVALDEGVEITDLGSSNGTFVAGERVERAVAHQGDAVRFGNLSFVLLLDDDVAERRDTPKSAPPAAAIEAAAAQKPRRWPHPALLARLRINALRTRRAVGGLALLVALIGAGLVVAKLGSKGVSLLGAPERTPGRLGRAALRAVGAGPSPAEHRRVVAIAAGKATARELLAKNHAAAAEAAWRQVLDLDPCDSDALRGLYDSRELQRRMSAHSLAEGELTQGNAREALVALAGALDAPWPGPPHELDASPGLAEVSSTVQRSLRKARQALAETAGVRGAQACLDGQFEACLEQAARARGFAPEHPAAPVLEAWVHDVLGETLKPMAERYPEILLRQAMWAYAAGAEEGALVKAKPLLCARCTATHKALREQLQRRHQADAQLGTSEPEEALEQYEAARTADLELIPDSVPSVARLKLTRALQDTYLTLGQAAFARGSYGDALEAWQQGQALAADYAPLEEAVAKLLARAQQLLDAWRHGDKQNKTGFAAGDRCLPLREVVAMTPVDAPLHHAALADLEACRSGKRSRGATTHVEEEDARPGRRNIYGD